MRLCRLPRFGTFDPAEGGLTGLRGRIRSVCSTRLLRAWRMFSTGVVQSPGVGGTNAGGGRAWCHLPGPSANRRVYLGAPQVSTPRAPAKWTMAVSDEIRRSKLTRMAAVSAKASGPVSVSSPSVKLSVKTDGASPCSARVAGCLRGTPSLSATPPSEPLTRTTRGANQPDQQAAQARPDSWGCPASGCPRGDWLVSSFGPPGR